MRHEYCRTRRRKGGRNGQYECDGRPTEKRRVDWKTGSGNGKSQVNE